jgi:preprotein translocase subunit SecE
MDIRPAQGLFKNQVKIMKSLSKIPEYIRESISELKKVTWPTKKQTINYTLVIIGLSLALALFIGIADYILALGVEQIIK